MMPSPDKPTDRDTRYVLGHSEREIDRLIAQAGFIEPITRRFFVEAGIAPGMTILDVGCGVGDVAFLAAELVGPSGEVVGIDRLHRRSLSLGAERKSCRSLLCPSVRMTCRTCRSVGSSMPS
jgi:2-polyprenyl-3-methyl-5-hydroxy-6-metoxy-1,4-benzoquinol methylase